MILNSNEICLKLFARWAPNSTAVPETIDSSSICSDSRKILENSFFIALKGENFDGHNFISDAINAGAKALCIEKSKSQIIKDLVLPTLIVDNTITAYQQLAELNRQKTSANIIAITGTCGKTSTKDFLRGIMTEAYGGDAIIATEGNTNNHIGVPLNLLRITDKHKFAIIEIGTNHFGEIESLSNCARPDIAIISSIGKGHLEFLNSVEGVAKEKSSIFKGLKPGGIAIIPATCEFRNILMNEARKANARILSFSTNPLIRADLNLKCIRSSFDGSEIEIDFQKTEKKPRRIFLPVPGEHQISNAAVAAISAYTVGIEIDTICSALEKISLSGMRMRKKNINGINFINDAYNSNPDSAKAGIRWLSEILPAYSRIFIFLGDMLELGGESQKLHLELMKYCLEKIPGASIIPVGNFMSEAAHNSRISQINSFLNSDDAANFAKSVLKDGDIVYIKGSRGMKMEKIENIFEA